jgi:hypothetical protein
MSSKAYYPPVQYRQTDARVCAALLLFLSPLLCAISTQAQDNSAAQLSVFQIPPTDLAVKSAVLSPDGKQVAAVLFKEPFAPGPSDIAVSLRLWKVGMPEPIASTQVSARPEDGEVGDTHGYVGSAYVQFCNHGVGIMLAELDGTLHFLNPQTLEELHATATNMTMTKTVPLYINLRHMRAHCAANSSRAVVAVFGGFVGVDTGHPQSNHAVTIRVYDLSSGTLVREWNMTDELFEDVAISPSGNEIALSHVPANRPGLPKNAHLLELFDVNTGTSTLGVKTGGRPGRITFAGETRVATADAPELFSRHPTIQLWDVSNGKLVREFAAPRAGARRLVGASSDGSVILGYIPRETLRTRGADEDSDRRFRLWDAASGQTIATSPPTYPQLSSDNCLKCDPGLALSANGNAVVVFAPWRSFTLPIYVFSLPPAAPAQLH